MGFIAHISDLHFGREDRRVTEGLLTDLAQARPDLIAISGDITQRARTKEFANARNFLRLLPFPYLIIPGNHDVAALNPLERLFRPFGRYCRYISANLCPNFQGGDFFIAGINASRPFQFSLDWGRGKLSGRLLSHLAEILDSGPARGIRIVVVHQPFLLSPETMQRGRMGGASAALDCFYRTNVRLVLSGHLHKSISGIIGRNASGRSIIAVEAGTAISTRVKYEPNAYNWIHFDSEKIVIAVRTWHGSAFDTSAIAEYLE